MPTADRIARRHSSPRPNTPEVVVITGASAGVGRAVARRFAQDGAHIGLLARGLERLDDARCEVERAGARALAIQTDVADWEQVDAAATAAEAEFGPIDVWINNAMTSVFSPIREMEPQEYRRVSEVTFLGSVHGTLAALRRMLPRDRGSNVQVGSALAYRGIPLQSAYCAAKHAIQGFMDSLRAELIHDGSSVQVTSVHLPAVNTPQFGWVKSRLPNKAQPVPPIYQPEVAAEAIHWAAHHERREIWLDRYLGRTGYESQQTEEPEDLQRPHNLWAPVPGHQAAHGVFDDRASARSLQAWATTHRTLTVSLGLAALGVLAVGAHSAIASE
jgi:NAD(P)-dependent dehydrogenase (short-subunit alcohol dehydrogenase family)